MRSQQYEDAGEEIIEETIAPEPAEAARQEEEDEVIKIKVRVEPREAPDTLPNHQSRAVNAITFMVTRPGTAWHHLHVLGSQSAFQDHEDQTSLTRRRNREKLIMTTCFQA